MSEKNEMTYPAVSGLSGARIRVVKQVRDRTSEPTSRLATISGTCRIGDTFYLLTAAHVFFDGFSSTESWADSGLYANSGTSSVFYDQVKPPKVTGSFAVSIEYDNRSQGGSNMETATTALGLVSISLIHGRYATTSAGSRNVILDFDLDWALIELREPHHWVPTQLHQSPNEKCFLSIPEDSGPPPPGPLLLITGVSGIVKATSMGSIGGLVLPWCQEEIKTGLLECSIAVGDCGSIAVSPKTGTVYGLVVAHDPDMLLTYLIPIKAIIDRASAVLPGLGDPSGSLFLTSFEATSETPGLSQAVQKIDPGKEQDDGMVDKRTVDKQPADSNADNDISIMAEYHRKLAENSLRNPKGLRYIRVPALVKWLSQTNSTGEMNLELLLDQCYSQLVMVPISAKSLLHGPRAGVVLFCILLELGMGHLIHTFVRLELTDNILPFGAVQVARVFDTKQSQEAFFNALWAYCPVKLSLDMAIDLSTDQVLPIHEQRLISSGGTAQVFEIIVLEDFVTDSLRQVCRRSRFEVENYGIAYRFALKTFSADALEIYESELNALLAFRDNRFLNRALGSFTRNEKSIINAPARTYNILLEFLENNLQSLFEQKPPPLPSADIVTFWTGMLGIAEAVSTIHNFSKTRGGRRNVFHGWHADIKPANILLYDGPAGALKNDVLIPGSQFKLADFGFARFERSNIDVTRIFGGTKVYAAPEISRAGTSLQSANRSIDIWSLGCVFSLATTWIVLGPEGIFRYKLLRENAQNTIQGRDDSNHATPPAAFHDGENLLEEVRDWHHFLKVTARRNDYITVKMIDLIEEKMLVPQASHRMEAAEICEAMRGLLRATREDILSTISPKVLDTLNSSKISNRMVEMRDPFPAPSGAEFGPQNVYPTQSKAEGKAAEDESPVSKPNNSFSRHKHELLSTSTSIRLVTLHPAIDSEQEIICELDQFELSPETTPKYEAVSWLRGAHSEHDIKVVFGSTTYVRTVTANLISVLKILRLTHKKLVLWIDVLCIDMGNIQERNNQIMIMSSIFGMAQNVCVWLGEADSASDIAFDFIRDEVLKLQGFDQLCEDPAAVPKWRALHNLMGREWFQRRWIIQEIALAKEAVLVCGTKTLPWTDFANAVQLFVEVETATHRLSEVMRKDPAFYHLPAWFEYVSALSASLLVDAAGSLFRKSEKKLVPLQTLEYLVSSLTVFKNTTPHDTIYSLLSIAKDAIPTSRNGGIDAPTSIRTYSEQAMFYPINYSLLVEDMCIDFISFAISQCIKTDPFRALDIICRPWAPKPRSTSKSSDSRSFPTWAAPISDAAFETFQHVNAEYRMGRKNADSLVGLPSPNPRNYSAAGTFFLRNFKHNKGDGFHSLFVRGFILDTVRMVSVASQNGNIPEEWLKTAGWTDTESEVPEAFWRTLVADRGSHGRNPPAYYRRVCQTFLAKGLGSGSVNTTELINEGRSSVVAEFFRRVQAVIWNRSLMRTENDHLGIVRKDVRHGDKICILYGCSVPVILREHDKSSSDVQEEREDYEKNKEDKLGFTSESLHHGEDYLWYELLGECYVHSMMDGEAITHQDRHGIRKSLFELR